MFKFSIKKVYNSNISSSTSLLFDSLVTQNVHLYFANYKAENINH